MASRVDVVRDISATRTSQQSAPGPITLKQDPNDVIPSVDRDVAHLLPTPQSLSDSVLTLQGVSPDPSASQRTDIDRNDTEMLQPSSSTGSSDNEHDESHTNTDLPHFAFDEFTSSLEIDTALTGDYQVAVHERSIPAPRNSESGDNTASAFSSNITVNRPYRSRYERTSIPGNDRTRASDSNNSAFKRGYDQVMPTTGLTPPSESYVPPERASEAAGGGLDNQSTAVRSLSSYRHSFDSQRATVTNRMRYLREHDVATSTLRRRSPLPSHSSSTTPRRTDQLSSEDTVSATQAADRAKRRKAGANETIHDTDQHMRTSVDTHNRVSTFAPALGRYPPQPAPIDPVLTSTSQMTDSDQESSTGLRHDPLDDTASGNSGHARTVTHFPSLSTFRRATSTSFQVAAPASFIRPSSTASTSAFSVTPSSSGQSVLRPRSARAREISRLADERDERPGLLHEELPHHRASEDLEAYGRAIVEQASVRLTQALETSRRSERLLHEDMHLNRVARTDEQEDDVERQTAQMLEDLPSPPALGTNGQVESDRPVIGIRIGERWRNGPEPQLDTTIATAPLSRMSSLSFSSPTSPRSPNGIGSGSTGSRASIFLNNLRTHRPHLSRNSTRVPPPEESPELLLAEEGRNWFQSRPRRIDGTERRVEAGTSGEERRERSSFRTALDFVRSRPLSSDSAREQHGHHQTSGASPNETTTQQLWGQVGEDEDVFGIFSESRPLSLFSRRMRGPTERANERWRMGQAPASALTSTTATHVDRLPPWRRSEDRSDGFPPFFLTPNEPSHRTLSPSDPDNGRTEVHPFNRAESPSPPRSIYARNGLGFPRPERRRRLNESDMQDVYRGATEADEARAGTRLSLRLAAPQIQIQRARANVNPLAADDADNDDIDEVPTPQLAGFSSQSMVAPMLPSGSSGRRGAVSPPATGFAGPLGSDFEEPTSTSAESSTRRRVPERRVLARPLLTSLLSETFARHDNETNSRVDVIGDESSTLRRRRTIFDSPIPRGAVAVDFDPAAGTTTTAGESDRELASGGFAARRERLASMRRERNIMRTLLGSGDRSASDVAASEPASAEPQEDDVTTAPRSPGTTRRRGLGEFFRGIGGVGGRFVAAWDDDFINFFTRGSAALDPRNYLDDDEFDSSYDALIRLSERLGDAKEKGIGADKLATLQTFSYAEWPMPRRRSTSTQDSPSQAQPIATTSAVTMDEDGASSRSPDFARRGLDKEERCAICLQDYEDDDECMLGVCQHGFHADCFKAWLATHGTCPVCRTAQA